MFTDPTVAGSWLDLSDQLDRNGTFARWAQTELAMTGISGAEQLAALLAVDSVLDVARRDELLGALVRLGCRAGGDDPDAVLLVVHLLSDGLYAIEARWSDAGPGVLPLLVGELTAQLRAWPLRRTRAYAANLLRDTEMVCRHELRPHRTRTYRCGGDLLVDPVDPREMRYWFDTATPGPGEGPAFELSDLLAWARRRGIANADDLALLVALETERGHGTAARARVAAAFGIHVNTLRRRRERTLAALRAAVADYLVESAAGEMNRAGAVTRAAA